MTGAVVVIGWIVLFILAGTSLPILVRRRREPALALANTPPTTDPAPRAHPRLIDQVRTTWFNYWIPVVVGVAAGVIAAISHDGGLLAGIFGPLLLSNAYVWFSSAYLIPRSVNSYVQVVAFSVINAMFFPAFAVYLG